MAVDSARIRYRVEGMDCGSCAAKIDHAVRRLPGVVDLSVSATAGTMTVELDDPARRAAVEHAVRNLGYDLAPRDQGARPGEIPRTGSDRCCAGASCASGGSASHDHDHDHDHDHGDQHRHDRETGGRAHDPHGPGRDSHGHDHDHDLGDGPWWKTGKARLALFSGAALALAYGFGHLFPAYGPEAFVGAMLVGLVPIARRAIFAALAGVPFTIEMLMTIAALGAVIIDAGEEAAMVVFLFLVGELLEGIAAGRARASIRALTDLVPKTALLDAGGVTREVPAESLAIGAVILVRPGDRMPADGVILEGASTVDEAPVTGESTPVSRQAGDPVYAGTINGEAVLKIRVTAAASDNTIARVIRLVEEAQEAKSPTERFIDRFSRYYTPGVLVVGALVAFVPPLVAGASLSEWVYKGLAVLLIGCPCALVISTPAAIAAALSAGARRGLLLKGGAVLEAFRSIDTVALDKTGTLTEGRPLVTDIVPLGLGEGDVLRLAAALEQGSSHPLALAILARAQADGVTVPAATEARAIGGKGVSALVGTQRVFLGSPGAAAGQAGLDDGLKETIRQFNADGKTVSVLLTDDRVAGLIAMRDEPRSDARAGLDALKRMGIRTVMLTGDNPVTAAAIGARLGMDDIRAGLLPEDKQAVVAGLRRDGRRVAKVGDGINDAPALAAADIGIAMGGGTDVALETADAAILNGRVTDLVRMIQLSRATMNTITQNITMALGLKGVFLVTTILGVTGLWPAILADTGATVLVTLNALRLLSPSLETDRI